MAFIGAQLVGHVGEKGALSPVGFLYLAIGLFQVARLLQELGVGCPQSAVAIHQSQAKPDRQ